MGCFGEVSIKWIVDQLAVVGVTAYLRIRQHSGMVSSVVSALGTSEMLQRAVSVGQGQSDRCFPGFCIFKLLVLRS